MGLITLCNKMRTCEQQSVSDSIYTAFYGTRKWTGASSMRRMACLVWWSVWQVYGGRKSEVARFWDGSALIYHSHGQKDCSSFCLFFFYSSSLIPCTGPVVQCWKIMIINNLQFIININRKFSKWALA